MICLYRVGKVHKHTHTPLCSINTMQTIDHTQCKHYNVNLNSNNGSIRPSEYHNHAAVCILIKKSKMPMKKS